MSNIFERFHGSLLAGPEQRLLRRIAVALPERVKPDQLTALGVAGAALVLVGYLATDASPQFLWLANFGLLVHWLGDSLDGTLARVRQIERPRYGFYLDQNVDLVGNLLIAVGLGASSYVRMDIALLALAGYHLLSIHVFVDTIVRREFHVDVMGLGPTEMRIGIAALNFAILIFDATPWTLGSLRATWCDGLVLLAFAGMCTLFAIAVGARLKELALEEPAIDPPRGRP